MTVVYSSMYGGYDNVVVPAAQDVPCEWVMFTDNADLDCPPPWRQYVWKAPFPDSPRMSSKWFKFLPHKCLPDAPETVFLDANMLVTAPSFVRDTLACRRDGFAVWLHAQRHSIYDEARATLRLCPQKYPGQPLIDQVEHYRQSGLPRHQLYATGTLARTASALNEAVGEAWLEECLRWSHQDQLSLPYVLWVHGVKPGVFPYRQINGRSLSNPWLKILHHNRDD